MLNDVSALLYILTMGHFCIYTMLDFISKVTLLVEVIRMDLGDAMTKLKHCHGAHIMIN